MKNVLCLTCGLLLPSNVNYHSHNVSTHTVEELSVTILKLLQQIDKPFTISSRAVAGLKCCNKNQKMDVKKNSDTFQQEFRECMDEVIELGSIEGQDNLTVQSLFLKSNLTPNSRHIIEVEEKRQSRDVIKVLSKELNAAVVHFQNDFLSTGVTGCPEKQKKRSNSETPADSPRRKKPKKKSKKSSREKKKKERRQLAPPPSEEPSRVESSSIEVTTTAKERKSLVRDEGESNPNVKIVLRSGRTIKTNPKYEDFVYYDDFKENLQRNISVHCPDASKSIVRRAPRAQPKATSSDSASQPSPCLKSDTGPQLSLEPLNNKILDFLAAEWNLSDWNLNDELDISIEDLDLAGFDDLGGTLPESQILTIENLLQELDGGGSIEISNIIKENNLDSDTVVLDALSQTGSNLGKESFPDWTELVSGAQGNAPTAKDSAKAGHRPNYCEICRKQYTNKSHFKSHREKCHINATKMLYKCTTCDKVFEFLSAFEKHVKEHNPSQTFICELCGRNFKNLINLKIHFALHKKDKVYECKLCPKKYYLKYSYLSHLKTHSTQGNYHCESCQKTFTQKLHFTLHLKKHDSGKYLGWSRDYRCNYCSDAKSPDELSSVTDGRQSFVTCLKCGKGLYKKYLLRNEEYIQKVGEAEPAREECKICGKLVKHLKKHIRETHLSNPVVQCDVCGQAVKKSGLNAHKYRAHSGVPSTCDHCNKVFKNALALQEHVNKVKKKAGQS